MNINNYGNYWWIPLVVICIALYKYILRFLFGMVIVPEDRTGTLFLEMGLAVRCNHGAIHSYSRRKNWPCTS